MIFVEGWTEHALEAEDPPGSERRAPDHHRPWVRDDLAALIESQERRAAGRKILRPHLAGDGFPVIWRRSVGDHATLAGLPREMGLRPGSYYVEAPTDPVQPFCPDAPSSVVALDPGGDLADWRSLCWRDRRTGARVPRVSLDLGGVGALMLVDLGDHVRRWATPVPLEPSVPLLVIPELIRRSGRSGAMLRGDPTVTVAGEDEGALVQRLTRVLGSAEMARRTGMSFGTVRRWRQRRPRPSSTARVLRSLGRQGVMETLAQSRRCEGCEHPLDGRQRKWCADCRRRRVDQRRGTS